MRKKRMAAIAVTVYLLSMTGSVGFLANGEGMNLSESELGMMCVSAVYPAVTRGGREPAKEEGQVRVSEEGKTETGKQDGGTPAETGSEGAVQGENGGVPVVSAPVIPAVESKEPLVIIYHTHATEAYQPVTDGNFRTTEVDGSVREVGNVLAAELQSLGIGVIHDATLHDAESYNQSYERSKQTITGLLAQYPSAVFVIDLHRDAAAYAGAASKTVTIEGETAASYALVVGEGNPNASMLKTFANTVNDKAETMYPGFGGRIISKTYKYNQYVSDYHLLLEVGNNESNIRDACTTAKYFAHVLASVIEETI